MADFLSKLKDFTQNISKKESKSVLGIDISASAIKLVQLQKKGGKAVLETYGEIALGPYADLEVGQSANLTPEKTAEALKDLMREAKTTTIDCGVAIPFSSSLISVIEVPTTDEKRLKDIIPIEARKYIPVPVSEVYLDWHVIPPEKTDEREGSEKKQKTEVLVVAIHKESINRYQRIIEASGLNTTFLEIEIFSTVRAVLDHGITPVMVADLGASTTKLYIVEHGTVRRSHTINKGTQDVTVAIEKSLGVSRGKAEEIMRTDINMASAEDEDGATNAASVVLDYIFSEVGRIMVDYEKKENKTINLISLTGGGALFKGLRDIAKSRFATDVEVANPFKKVETPAFLQDVLETAGPGFAVAIGVALRKIDEEFS